MRSWRISCDPICVSSAPDRAACRWRPSRPCSASPWSSSRRAAWAANASNRLRAVEGADRRGGARRTPSGEPAPSAPGPGAEGRLRQGPRPCARRHRGDRADRFRRAVHRPRRPGDQSRGPVHRPRPRGRRDSPSGRGASSSPSARTPRCRPLRASPGACLTNDTVFDLPATPSRLVVIGGGPIGVELAQAHRRLGAP